MTNQEPRQQPYPENYPPYEDEINLIDYLRVLWKWKWLIIVGCLICAIVAALISFQMPKVYSIDLVLKPGMLGVEKDNKIVYIDSVDDVKSLIESGIFDNDILESIKKDSSSENLPGFLSFKINAASNMLKITYETSDIDFGVNVLKHLGKLLLERYDSLVHSYLNERKAEIDIFNTHEENIKNAKKKIEELESEIDLLIKKRDKTCLTDGNKNNILLAVLYDNTIQQKMTLANTYWLELNQWFAKKENSKYKFLRFDESKIHKIQTIPPPVSNPHLIKPKKKQIIMLSVVVGFFFFIFLAFFIEYIKNASKVSSGEKER